jgi:hypothetical protein
LFLVSTEKKLPEDGECPITFWQFHNQTIQVLLLITQKSQVILVQAPVIRPPLAGNQVVDLQFFIIIHPIIDAGGILKKISRLAKQVKADIGDGYILLQYRPMATPFAIALTKYESIVSEMKRVCELGCAQVYKIRINNIQCPMSKILSFSRKHFVDHWTLDIGHWTLMLHVF